MMRAASVGPIPSSSSSWACVALARLSGPAGAPGAAGATAAVAARRAASGHDDLLAVLHPRREVGGGELGLPGRAAGEPQRDRDAGAVGHAVEPRPPDRAGDVDVDAALGGVPLGRPRRGRLLDGDGRRVGLAACHDAVADREDEQRGRDPGEEARAVVEHASTLRARALQVGCERYEVNEGRARLAGGGGEIAPLRCNIAVTGVSGRRSRAGLRALRH